MIATHKLIAAIGLLTIALAASVTQNVQQWSDARVVASEHEAAIKAAIAQGERQALTSSIETSERILLQAEEDRIAMEAEREEYIATLNRRERAYLQRIADIELTCGPGQSFVDAFNGETSAIAPFGE